MFIVKSALLGPLSSFFSFFSFSLLFVLFRVFVLFVPASSITRSRDVAKSTKPSSTTSPGVSLKCLEGEGE
jgi:hypothetical protein